MRKITKNFTAIPQSLIPAFEDLFPERAVRRLVPIPQTSRTTHFRRMEIIEHGSYITHDNYNSRYKLEDIRQELDSIYKGKCVFCEQKEELTHIEHYRPKDIYYWLAYSWDNLLMSCPTCNMHKGTKFEIEGDLAIFENTNLNIRNINRISPTYDELELPKMVNLEVTDPSGYVHFEKDGSIRSDNIRFAYTIESCQIDRKNLNDSRRSLLDRFKEHIRDALIENQTEHDQQVAIITNIRNFVIDSDNDDMDFSAFRRYAVANDWMNEIIKEIN